jgi:hypothetical protein
MKKQISIIGLLVISAIMFQGCFKDKQIESKTYIANAPVYKTYKEVRAEIRNEEPRELVNPRKVFLTEKYIFVNELDKGVHVINNTNPTSPQIETFINIPGNVDIFVVGDVLYADSYTDLVAINVSDVKNISVLDRQIDVFAYLLPPHDDTYPIARIEKEKGVVVDWEIRKVTDNCVDGECESYYSNKIDTRISFDASTSSASGNVGGSNKSSFRGVSVAGSMSRFMNYENYLYAIDNFTKINVFDIRNNSKPTLKNSFRVNEGIETLFSYANNMFIGSTTGLYIYGLTKPESPEFYSTFEHATGCDPVVVDGKYAYVTIRSGNGCGGWTDQLDVINVENMMSPYLVSTLTLSDPHGLGVDGANNLLFVCDGNAGLKVFNNDPYNLINNQIGTLTSSQAYDVIPYNGYALMVGYDGIYQYDYTNKNNISQLSVVPVTRK